VNSNAASAREANDLVVGTSGIVSDGKEKITRMVDSMDRIKQSSADIAKIIKVIDEIAFQTNLLALNAAVEAARAGQHGRGFAVVAAEVRNLAGRSAKAAQETSELIVGSSKRVEAGVEVSNQAREAFDKIADDIAQVTDLVGKITLASDEQARGVTYINRAIQEISDAAMTNAVRAEELTVVANELSTSTDGVSHQIARFNLGNPGSGRRSPIASAPAAAPEPVAPANNAPVPNGAMMNGSSSSGLDVDERGFGRY
jgi:methyl-accepting chemotaxis protein